jgi:hypothetical protein
MRDGALRTRPAEGFMGPRLPVHQRSLGGFGVDLGEWAVLPKTRNIKVMARRVVTIAEKTPKFM